MVLAAGLVVIFRVVVVLGSAVVVTVVVVVSCELGSEGEEEESLSLVHPTPATYR